MSGFSQQVFAELGAIGCKRTLLPHAFGTNRIACLVLLLLFQSKASSAKICAVKFLSLDTVHGI